jgi:hypothetical protein
MRSAFTVEKGAREARVQEWDRLGRKGADKADLVGGRASLVAGAAADKHVAVPEYFLQPSLDFPRGGVPGEGAGFGGLFVH